MARRQRVFSQRDAYPDFLIGLLRELNNRVRRGDTLFRLEELGPESALSAEIRKYKPDYIGVPATTDPKEILTPGNFRYLMKVLRTMSAALGSFPWTLDYVRGKVVALSKTTPGEDFEPDKPDVLGMFRQRLDIRPSDIPALAIACLAVGVPLSSWVNLAVPQVYGSYLFASSVAFAFLLWAYHLAGTRTRRFCVFLLLLVWAMYLGAFHVLSQTPVGFLSAGSEPINLVLTFDGELSGAEGESASPQIEVDGKEAESVESEELEQAGEETDQPSDTEGQDPLDAAREMQAEPGIAEEDRSPQSFVGQLRTGAEDLISYVNPQTMSRLPEAELPRRKQREAPSATELRIREMQLHGEIAGILQRGSVTGAGPGRGALPMGPKAREYIGGYQGATAGLNNTYVHFVVDVSSSITSAQLDEKFLIMSYLYSNLLCDPELQSRNVRFAISGLGERHLKLLGYADSASPSRVFAANKRLRAIMGDYGTDIRRTLDEVIRMNRPVSRNVRVVCVMITDAEDSNEMAIRDRIVDASRFMQLYLVSVNSPTVERYPNAVNLHDPTGKTLMDLLTRLLQMEGGQNPQPADELRKRLGLEDGVRTKK